MINRVKKLNVKIVHLDRKLEEIDELRKTIKNLQDIVNELKVTKETPESKGKSKQNKRKEGRDHEGRIFHKL